MNEIFNFSQLQFLCVFPYLDIWIVGGEEVLAPTCDEVLDNLEDISSLEMLSGLATEYQIIARIQRV